MRKSNVSLIFILLCIILIPGSYHAVYAQATSEEEFTLEEITVTAEKREVDIQKTALAIEAVSGAEISGKAIGNVSDLLDGLTAVKVMGGPMGGKIFIRGIGSNIDTNLASPSVALQKDNVYLGQSEAVLGALYDIDRVEVLYGPQGTMYGKNAAGGQVNIITKNPTDKFEANAGLSVGTYNLVSYNAALNVPFSPQWAARLAIDQQTHDGYIDDGSGSADKFSARVKLSYKPSDRISLLFTAERTSDKSTNMNTVPVPGSAGNLINMGFVVPDTDGDGEADDSDGDGIIDLVETGWEKPNGGDAWSNDIYHPAPINDSIYNTFSMQADIDIGFSTLTLIPTFNSNRRLLWSDLIEGSSTGKELTEQSYRETQQSMELRLASSEDSSLMWTIGGYWFKNDNKEIDVETEDLLDQAADTWENGSEGGGPGQDAMDPYTSDNVLTANYRTPQDSLAAFGQATYPITDKLRFTGGIRWNNDNNNLKYRIVIYDVTEDGDYATYYDDAVEVDGRHQYDSGIIKYTVESSPFTYKAGLEYDLDTNKMLYANFTTGYKNGGLNIQGVTPPVAYDPEEVFNYSAGIKSRFLNNRLQFNAEAYYYLYKGMQQQCQVSGIYDPVRKQTTGGMIIVNAEEGKSAGMEISLDWLPTAKDRLSVTTAYMNTEFGKLILPASPFYAYETDKTGDDLPKAPHFSGTLGYEHIFNLDDGATITPRFQTKISSGFDNTHETYLAGSHTDSYSMSDFYLTYGSANGKYTTTLWIKNVENAAVTDYAFPMYRRIVMEPRTSGLTFNINF